jgi:hypothetical protein
MTVMEVNYLLIVAGANEEMETGKQPVIGLNSDSGIGSPNAMKSGTF